MISRRERRQKVGIDYDEGPPVPIPNTEVKLGRAENTWLATARKNRFLPTPSGHFKMTAFLFDLS